MSGEIERLSGEVGSQPPDNAGTAVSPVDIQETVRAAKEYARAARAPNTLRAYNSDIEDFSTYCRVELGGASALPASAETVTLYITDMATDEPVGRGLKVSTIGRRLASISAWHKREGFLSPTEDRLVRETMKGIRKGGEDHLFCRIDRHGNLKAGGISGDGINELVKKRVKNAGLDATRYSGHSLRAGLPTSASEEKVGLEAWMPHTRHKSVKVAMGYARTGTLFTNNPASQVGL